MDESESFLNDGSDKSSFLYFRRFFSYRVYFSLMMSFTIMGMGLGHLVHALFHPALEIMLVVSVAEDLAFLVDSQKYFPAQNIEFLS